jgi:hypothetical protein
MLRSSFLNMACPWKQAAYIHRKPAVTHTEGEPDVTLESLTTEWFRNTFDLEKYLFGDGDSTPEPRNVDPIQLQCMDGGGRMSPEAIQMHFLQTMNGKQPSPAASPVRVMDFADGRAQQRLKSSPSKPNPAAESSTPQGRESDLDGKNMGSVLPSTASDVAIPNLEVNDHDEIVMPHLTPPKVKGLAPFREVLPALLF